MKKTNKIIIFGANGFIGQNLTNYLKKKKLKLFGFSNKKYFNKKTISKYNLVKKHISNCKTNIINYDNSNFKKVISKIKPDIIFYLSGNSYPGNTMSNSLYDFESSNIPLQNFLSAIQLLNFKGKIIYTSSIAVYGNSKTCNELSKPNPKNFYGLSKLICEEQIKYFSKKNGLNITIARLSSVYGAKLERQVIYDILKQINKNNTKIKLNGSALDERQLLHVDDLVELLFLLAKTKDKKGYNIYNVANGNKIKIKNIEKIVNKIFKKKFSFYFSKRNQDKFNNLPKLLNNKIKKISKKKNYLTLESGIKKTYEWISIKK